MIYNIDIKNVKKKENSKIKCTFSVIINDCIELHSVKLVFSDKTDKYYVFFPSFQYKDKNYNYVSLSSSLHNKVLDSILKEYNKPEITL